VVETSWRFCFTTLIEASFKACRTRLEDCCEEVWKDAASTPGWSGGFEGESSLSRHGRVLELLPRRLLSFFFCLGSGGRWFSSLIIGNNRVTMDCDAIRQWTSVAVPKMISRFWTLGSSHVAPVWYSCNRIFRRTNLLECRMIQMMVHSKNERKDDAKWKNRMQARKEGRKSLMRYAIAIHARNRRHLASLDLREVARLVASSRICNHKTMMSAVTKLRNIYMLKLLITIPFVESLERRYSSTDSKHPSPCKASRTATLLPMDVVYSRVTETDSSSDL
jgi:hypothetical protein